MPRASFRCRGQATKDLPAIYHHLFGTALVPYAGPCRWWAHMISHIAFSGWVRPGYMATSPKALGEEHYPRPGSREGAEGDAERSPAEDPGEAEEAAGAEQAVNTLKRCAQTAVEDTERIWTELICSIEKKRSELTELIRAQEEAELSAAEEHSEKLEQEIADLKRRNTELEQLSFTEDRIHFLQSFQSLSVSSGSEDSSSISVHHHLSFDGVRSALSDLKERLEEFCREEFKKIPPQAAPAPLLLSEPRSRQDFLQYFCHLTLDPNTAYRRLILSENNRAMILSDEDQHYPDHPERFVDLYQVLSVESLTGRCYWEVEYSGVAAIAVVYKDISRKGQNSDGEFGYNSQSWRLFCSTDAAVWHCCCRTEFPEAPLCKVGVYVDHSAGILSFYSVSDTMTLLHTVHSTFTQLLYAGFEQHQLEREIQPDKLPKSTSSTLTDTLTDCSSDDHAAIIKHVIGEQNESSVQET
ncbi:tripartite motif-containing protein 16-like [Colossoma macropomum]|uniref:tripartite motif-containing protein 16-like n=1 Tax=Colossoma macropomum TaxID=42526 RepID=UPI0018646D8D|nr:tripartite motif-containing protein 16-like [Colossoma macropomum]